MILSPNNGTKSTNSSNRTITNSITKAFSLLLKNPESFIPYIVLDATIIEDIPFEAIKYPTPNVIKNVGVIFVSVKIGVNNSAKLLFKPFCSNVEISSFDIFRYVQAYPINVMVGTNDKNRLKAIWPGNTSISGRQKAVQNL